MIIASTLTDSTLTTQDVAVFAAVIVFGIGIVKGLIWFLDRFYGKRDEKEKQTAQAEACRFDHQSINSILIQQNAHMTKLLEHMGTFLHTAELRHAAMISRMDLDKAEIVERLKNIYYQMPKRKDDERE